MTRSSLGRTLRRAYWILGLVLAISMAAKQKLMELEDPLMRLRLVDEYLRGKGVVSA